MRKITQFYDTDKPDPRDLLLAVDVSSRRLEDCTLAASDTRIRVGTVRRALFVDYQQSGDLSWGATGRALQECYGFDPWRITCKSYSQSIARMKAHRKGIPQRCLASIWRQAQSSCKAPLRGSQRATYSDQLG